MKNFSRAEIFFIDFVKWLFFLNYLKFLSFVKSIESETFHSVKIWGFSLWSKKMIFWNNFFVFDTVHSRFKVQVISEDFSLILEFNDKCVQDLMISYKIKWVNHNSYEKGLKWFQESSLDDRTCFKKCFIPKGLYFW